MKKEVENKCLNIENNVCNVVRMEVECEEGFFKWVWNIVILWIL